MIQYNKLVRDRIPEIIEAEGKRCEVRRLAEKEYGEKLGQKLAEELVEFQITGDVDELVDLVEVVEAMAVMRGLKWEKFEQLRRDKKHARGAFSNRTLLLWIDD